MARKDNNLVAREFHGSGLIAVDVSGRGADNSLPGFQHGVERHRIGLGSADQEENISVRIPAGFPYLLFCAFAVFVKSVCAGVFGVCICQSFQDCGMHPVAIIAIKINHIGQTCFWGHEYS